MLRARAYYARRNEAFVSYDGIAARRTNVRDTRLNMYPPRVFSVVSFARGPSWRLRSPRRRGNITM